MEINIYRNMAARSNGKRLFCARVSCPDAFSYGSAVDVFRSIYGSDIVIEFLVV